MLTGLALLLSSGKKHKLTDTHYGLYSAGKGDV